MCLGRRLLNAGQARNCPIQIASLAHEFPRHRFQCRFHARISRRARLVAIFLGLANAVGSIIMIVHHACTMIQIHAHVLMCIKCTVIQ